MQPVQVEQEIEAEDLSRKQDFDFSDLETLLNNKGYAQLCNYLKDYPLEAEEKAMLRANYAPTFS